MSKLSRIFQKLKGSQTKSHFDSVECPNCRALVDLDKTTWRELVFGRLPCCGEFLDEESVQKLAFAKKMRAETKKGES